MAISDIIIVFSTMFCLFCICLISINRDIKELYEHIIEGEKGIYKLIRISALEIIKLETEIEKLKTLLTDE